MKLVHAADLHIDSPLCGLERYEGAPVEQIRGATRRALENLVELCLSEEASLLLLAGDVFDDAATAQGLLTFFLQGLRRGALTETEVAATGLTPEEMGLRSFAGILARRVARK